jgi:hypothetical protein
MVWLQPVIDEAMMYDYCGDIIPFGYVVCSTQTELIRCTRYSGRY